MGQPPPPKTRAPWSGSSGATCSPATRPALGGEPLANRWRQRSTADRPGAQRPTQGPDIQPRPAMGSRVRAQTRTPPHSSHHTPRSSQGRAPRASAGPLPMATTPAELRRCPRIILHFCIEVCMHTTHRHMPTHSSVYTPHAHTHAYTLICVHTSHTAHTPTHSHPTPSCMCTRMLGSTTLQKRKPCPCVCASPPASSSVSGSLFTPPLGSWKDVKGVISSRETSERLKRAWGAISPVSHATLLSF